MSQAAPVAPGSRPPRRSSGILAGPSSYARRA
ncbi:hypothetical protein HNR17_002680 [Galbitalea soli]|nr:hypothetical protein [Galbitalea soli]